MALTGAAKILFRAVSAALIMASPAAGQQRLASVFTVANVAAQAEAADSVEAKKLATQMAEARAFHSLVARLTDFRSQAHIPELPQEQLEALISDIATSGEGVSATTYIANFTVSFSERGVEGLLARYGAFPILDRGPEILIVPVYIEDGAASVSERNPWRSAFLSLDLSHALVPARVAPVRNDLSAAIARAYIASPAASIETLKSQYHTTQILFAVAELELGGESISLKLIGNDASGLLSLQRKVKLKDADDQTLIQSAASLAFTTVQERWKLTRSGAGAVSADAGSSGSPGTTSSGFSTVELTAQFSGLKEWQAIRTRLLHIPGIQNWDLKSVNPRSAQIGFDFPGGAERLTAVASGQGLNIEKGPDGLVVKTR